MPWVKMSKSLVCSAFWHERREYRCNYVPFSTYNINSMDSLLERHLNNLVRNAFRWSESFLLFKQAFPLREGRGARKDKRRVCGIEWGEGAWASVSPFSLPWARSTCLSAFSRSKFPRADWRVAHRFADGVNGNSVVRVVSRLDFSVRAFASWTPVQIAFKARSCWKSSRDCVCERNTKKLCGFWLAFPGLSVLIRRLFRGSSQLISDSYLVDPASSHMLVSKIKPCMSKYKPH